MRFLVNYESLLSSEQLSSNNDAPINSLIKYSRASFYFNLRTVYKRLLPFPNFIIDGYVHEILLPILIFLPYYLTQKQRQQQNLMML